MGLNAGRVRLAGFASAIGSLVPAAAAALAARHPGLEISLTDAHPCEAIELLRTGKVEVAIIFRYDETEPEPPGVRLHHLLDDPVYLLSARRERSVAALRDATWIAGCERCRGHMLSVCADAGFEPRIGYSSDDMVVMGVLVAAGLGVQPRPDWPCAPTASRASSRPNCAARSGTSTPRHTASRPTRPPPPPFWRPWPRPPRRRPRQRSPLPCKTRRVGERHGLFVRVDQRPPQTTGEREDRRGLSNPTIDPVRWVHRGRTRSLRRRSRREGRAGTAGPWLGCGD